jgi:carbonic anhydrase/acetyltransferase-like protein (isoleucine patch superfamily)
MPIYALGAQVPEIHPTAYVHPEATVIGSVALGPEVTVWPGAVLRGDYGIISVGARTSIQDGTVVHTTSQWPTDIGAECVVGHNAHLEGCRVEDRCLVGSNSTVLNRAHVGRGSVVGAGAVVTEDTVVPAGSTAVGVPARIRPGGIEASRHDESVTRYVENGRRYAGELKPLS